MAERYCAADQGWDGIAAVLAQAEPGDTVRLAGARFTGDRPLAVPGGIHLAGTAGTVLAVPGHIPALRLDGVADTRVSDLTAVTTDGTAAADHPGLVHVESCSAIRLSRLQLHGAGEQRSGIKLKESSCDIDACAVDGFGLGGIEIGNSTATVADCHCRAGQTVGIGVVGVRASATLTGNTCSQNATGISIESASAEAVARNACCANRVHGIQVHVHSSIRAPPQARTLAGNRCERNGVAGIALVSAQVEWITANRCHRNGRDGITLERQPDLAAEPARAAVARNACAANGKDGITVLASEAEPIADNACWSNGRDGIRLGLGPIGAQQRAPAEAALLRNTCHHNGLHGIGLFSADSRRVGENRAHGNRGQGIAVGRDTDTPGVLSHAELDSNLAHANGASGISIAPGVGGATANACWANGGSAFHIVEHRPTSFELHDAQRDRPNDYRGRVAHGPLAEALAGENVPQEDADALADFVAGPGCPGCFRQYWDPAAELAAPPEAPRASQPESGTEPAWFTLSRDGAGRVQLSRHPRAEQHADSKESIDSLPKDLRRRLRALTPATETGWVQPVAAVGGSGDPLDELANQVRHWQAVRTGESQAASEAVEGLVHRLDKAACDLSDPRWIAPTAPTEASGPAASALEASLLELRQPNRERARLLATAWPSYALAAVLAGAAAAWPGWPWWNDSWAQQLADPAATALGYDGLIAALAALGLGCVYAANRFLPPALRLSAQRFRKLLPFVDADGARQRPASTDKQPSRGWRHMVQRRLYAPTRRRQALVLLLNRPELWSDAGVEELRAALRARPARKHVYLAVHLADRSQLGQWAAYLSTLAAENPGGSAAPHKTRPAQGQTTPHPDGVTVLFRGDPPSLAALEAAPAGERQTPRSAALLGLDSPAAADGFLHDAARGRWSGQQVPVLLALGTTPEAPLRLTLAATRDSELWKNALNEQLAGLGRAFQAHYPAAEAAQPPAPLQSAKAAEGLWRQLTAAEVISHWDELPTGRGATRHVFAGQARLRGEIARLLSSTFDDSGAASAYLAALLAAGEAGHLDTAWALLQADPFADANAENLAQRCRDHIAAAIRLQGERRRLDLGPDREASAPRDRELGERWRAVAAQLNSLAVSGDAKSQRAAAHLYATLTGAAAPESTAPLVPLPDLDDLDSDPDEPATPQACLAAAVKGFLQRLRRIDPDLAGDLLAHQFRGAWFRFPANLQEAIRAARERDRQANQWHLGELFAAAAGPQDVCARLDEHRFAPGTALTVLACCAVEALAPPEASAPSDDELNLAHGLSDLRAHCRQLDVGHPLAGTWDIPVSRPAPAALKALTSPETRTKLIKILTTPIEMPAQDLAGVARAVDGPADVMLNAAGASAAA